MNKKARILIAEDDLQMQFAMTASLQKAQYEVVVTSNGALCLEKIEQEHFDLLITDQRMPEMTGLELLAALKQKEISVPAIMITAHGTITQAVEAMQHGAADFISKPFSMEDLIRTVERVLSPDLVEFRNEKSQKSSKGRAIVTNDPLMIRILEVCEAVARSDATVLIQGESGTGKELIARLVHAASPRVNQPFVAVNCAALPETLLESELFGHEKGAFTGAQNRKLGKFELAHGGTILLDEISEMALPLQAKLLRVIQEREVDRVGGKEPIPIDVRVLATTNRNLEAAVRRGDFRGDLFYRLNVIPLTIPSLRERRGDILLLVQHFMKKFLGNNAPELPADVLEALQAHPWPGNIRELQNAVERAAILSRGSIPTQRDFLLDTRAGLDSSQTDSICLPETAMNSSTLSQKVEVDSMSDQSNNSNLFQGTTPTLNPHNSKKMIASGMTVAEVEKVLILETLQTTGFNRTEASKLLGISIRTLRNKLHEYKNEGCHVPE
jgi:DNA-binding NtrC family response regulator